MIKVFVNGVYEYDYQKIVRGEEECFQLFFSKSEVWNEAIRGTMAYEIIDNGSRLQTPLKKGKIEYDDELMLMIILNIKYRNSSFYEKIELATDCIQLI